MSQSPSGEKILHLLAHLDSGGQICTENQWIYRLNNQIPPEYFLCCDTEGCCDDTMSFEDLINYLHEPERWSMLPIKIQKRYTYEKPRS